ncbi:MAG: hypothetical protein IKL89_07915 [Clostridia bacterium]|nr:hypothetical protein [Clostridia bacterium]
MMAKKEVILGLDIGTTSLCAALAARDGSCPGTVTRKNTAHLPAAEDWRREQDAGIILEEIRALAEELCSAEAVCAIALSGQMHGILYLDRDGRALSSLRTWQDGRGGLPLPGGSCADRLGIPAGYGFSTLLCDFERGQIPAGAYSFCTVADYIALALTGERRPVMHVTNAASLGLFDVERACFDGRAEALCRAAGLQLPEISAEMRPVGRWGEIPVFCAIGDNQAAFRAAAGEGDALLNFGTGSQMSFLSDSPIPLPGLEVRPYLGGKFIQSGSALCGGRAYAALAELFAQFDRARGLSGAEIYETLGRLAEEAWERGDLPAADTAFAGTRQEPGRRGNITGISTENLTPGHLAAAILGGMVEELWRLFEGSGAVAGGVVLSGNAARKNPLLCRIAAVRTGLPVRISPVAEEAAYGAALAAGEEIWK